MRENMQSNQSQKKTVSPDQFIKKVLSITQEYEDKDRCLSCHVGSRWYRAPEVILVQKQYDQASDMWSMGCILFEILQVRYPSQDIINSGIIDPVLFRGTECYPLSFSK